MIIKRRNHHQSPEGRAILAQAPAFVFYTSVCNRLFEFSLRLAGGNVFRFVPQAGAAVLF